MRRTVATLAEGLRRHALAGRSARTVQTLVVHEGSRLAAAALGVSPVAHLTFAAGLFGVPAVMGSRHLLTDDVDADAQAVKTAQNAYNQLKEPPTQTDLAADRAQVANATAALASAQVLAPAAAPAPALSRATLRETDDPLTDSCCPTQPSPST